MTTDNGKPSLTAIARPDWDAHGSDRSDLELTSTGEAVAALSDASDDTFSAEARMAHELVSLFLGIEDPDTQARCLAFVRAQAEGLPD